MPGTLEYAFEDKLIPADTPIGVFDSGVGGLTVLRALRAALPAADYVYLGDTARLPYGTKSAETVARYSLQCAHTLMARQIGCLVVACNTASAFALPSLRARYPHLPIIGVIEPGAAAALAASKTRHIAVVATQATIDARAYERAIHAQDPNARVVSKACALLVAIAEEGWTEGAIAQAVTERYLQDLFASQDSPDTLVLGCTHFPLLLQAIRACIPAAVRIVDSAATTATRVAQLRAACTSPRPHGSVRWLATDGAARFAAVGARFLGEPIAPERIEIVDL